MRPLCYLFLILSTVAHSQKLKKKLQAEPWYFYGQISDHSLFLTKNKPDTIRSIAEFSSSNTLKLTTNGVVDSSYRYMVKKRSIVFKRLPADSISYDAYLESKGKELILCTFPKHSDSLFKVTTMQAITNDSLYRISRLYLNKGKRSREIERYDKVKLYYRTPLSDSNTVFETMKGEFYQVQDKAVILDTIGNSSEYFSISGRDTFPNLPAKIELKYIRKIKHERRAFNSITGSMIGLSLLSTLVVAPLVSLKSNGFNGDRYIKVAGCSLASVCFFTTLRISFGNKKMKIGSRKKDWKFE